MQTEQIVTIRYSIGGMPRFLRGKLLEETNEFYRIEGLKDGTIFNISKGTVEEIVEGRE